MKQECATFNWENRLTSDQCARDARNRENKEAEEYSLYNYFHDGDCGAERRKDFVCDYPNLWYRDGYGVANKCVIDKDTKIARGELTHGREKRQANIRTFHAVPDLSRGCLLPNTESRLIQGTCSKTNIQVCDILQERDFNRFVPFLSCVKEHLDDFDPSKHQVIGINTREATRKKCRTNINQK
jgi:hypothetical protein